MTLLDCSCSLPIHPIQARCNRCGVMTPNTKDCPGCQSAYEINIQKIIQNQVRVPSSEYMMNVGSLTVRGSSKNAPLMSFAYVNQNQSSDRAKLAVGKYSVPSSGNTTRRSITRLRPGSLNPGGTGVDIKHNSYARYLARLKAPNLTTLSPGAEFPRYGNKTIKYGMVADCICQKKA